MKEQEEKSGVSYSEVQRAMAEEIMSTAIHGVGKEFHEDSSDEEDMNRNPNERETMLDKKRKFEAAVKDVTIDKTNDWDGDAIADSSDNICQDCLDGAINVTEETWNPNHPEGEKENFVQEELYPHDKLLIVDDRIVVCGSSNINDRSQLG